MDQYESNTYFKSLIKDLVGFLNKEKHPNHYQSIINDPTSKMTNFNERLQRVKLPYNLFKCVRKDDDGKIKGRLPPMTLKIIEERKQKLDLAPNHVI